MPLSRSIMLTIHKYSAGPRLEMEPRRPLIRAGCSGCHAHPVARPRRGCARARALCCDLYKCKSHLQFRAERQSRPAGSSDIKQRQTDGQTDRAGPGRRNGRAPAGLQRRRGRLLGRPALMGLLWPETAPSLAHNRCQLGHANRRAGRRGANGSGTANKLVVGVSWQL